MEYKKYSDSVFLVSDESKQLGRIVNYSTGWAFAPNPIVLTYLQLRRLYNKVYQLRKRDKQE